MNLHDVPLVLVVVLACTYSLAAASDAPVPPKIALKAEPFALTQVRLLDGPFKHAQELDHQYLLSPRSGPAAAHFPHQRRAFPPRPSPGGWEEPKCEVRGPLRRPLSLSACALMYASTGDERLKQKAAAVVAGLAECQAKLGNGYLSAYPESFIDRVETLKPVWAPYYTLHKIFAGLQDVYVYCGNQQALDVCRKFGDWVIARNASSRDEQMQAMLGNEHGGMNETLANLYGLTGEAEYLAIARRFNHMKVIGPACKRQDRLTGLHANTQIPKFIGAARQYELTGEESFKTASTFFWETVVNERSYVDRRAQRRRAFFAQGKALRGPRTRHDRDLQHLQHAQAHAAPVLLGPAAAVCRLLRAGAVQPHPLLAEPGNGHDVLLPAAAIRLEQELQRTAGQLLVLHGHGRGEPCEVRRQHLLPRRAALYVNLFIASELDWKAKALKVRQETNFRTSHGRRLVFTCDQPHSWRLDIRHPWWATEKFEIRVNGEKQADQSKPGSYAVLIPRRGRAATPLRSRCPSRSALRVFATTRGGSPS